MTLRDKITKRERKKKSTQKSDDWTGNQETQTRISHQRWSQD